ncbi:MAG: EF-P lysine aminoacylase EpmA [Gammaproteobacteria bacterium]|jgi:lysyl-tRNA synthetase class 2|nr:EF-P lysine aminoacylase EpmA [Gammaproteobacteria bacterium]
MTESDSWRPTAALEVLRLRAAMLSRARAFFAQRDVLEVETPVLSIAGTTDPNIQSLTTRVSGFPGTLYLHTSPEFPMKRLLAAGSGDIYQFARVFRDGETGRRHNPEFTLLEYYRLGMDHHALMDDVAELVGCLLGDEHGAIACRRMSYRDAFMQAVELDPMTADRALLLETLSRHGVPLPVDPLSAAQLTDLIMATLVSPGLGREQPCFVYDFPVDQAALARIRAGHPPVAERFELFFQGMELANGFHELCDQREQRRRFAQDNALRVQEGLPQVTADERMLQALDSGLPDCAGVAVGFDRMVMLAAGARQLSEVLAFAILRA